jgi:hypothetical protein
MNLRRRKQGVCHIAALPFTLKTYIKTYLKAKEEELWKFKYFTMQKLHLQKKSSTRNQNPLRYHNSIITNLKFQHKPKYHLSKKNPHIKIDPLHRGPKSIEQATILSNESKHNRANKHS